MSECDVRAELLFLTVKLLEEESCSEAAESLKHYINTREILPARINVDGKCFPNTFENFDLSHGPIRPKMLLRNLTRLLQYFNQHSSPAAIQRNASMFASFLHLEKPHTVGLPCLSGHILSSPFRGQQVLRLHRQLRPANHCLAHRNAIYCLQQDQRNEFLFTGSDDCTIKVWDLRAQRSKPCHLRHTLRGHRAEIIELAISPDNHLLASVDYQCCLVVWCLRTGQPVVSVQGSRANRVISGMAFLTTPMGNTCSSPPDSELKASTLPSGWLAITSFGGFLHMIPYQHRPFRPEDANQTGTTRWQCCVVHLLPTVEFITGVGGTQTDSVPSVVCMDVSPGSSLVATGCSDQYIRLYHLRNPRKPEFSVALQAHEGSVNSVAFSHSGLKLASGSSCGGSCWLWRYQEGTWRSMVLAFRKRVKCRPCLLAWSRSDRYLIASMKNGTIYVYFGDSGHLATVIEGHEGDVPSLSPSPVDDEIVATGGIDGRFQVWNIKLQRHRDSAIGTSTFDPKSSEQPLLYHYRYNRCQFDPDTGLIWQPLDPSDRGPLPPNGNNVSESSIHAFQHETSAAHSRGTPHMQGDTGINPIVSNSALTARRIVVGGLSFKWQRITACRALPISEGVGFIVVTRSGLLSVFRPSDGDSEPSEDLTGIDKASLQTDEQFFHWELDAAASREIHVNLASNPSLRSVLGIPVSTPSSVVTGSRYSRDGRSLRSEPLIVSSDTSHGQSAQSGLPLVTAANSVELYRPPPDVCFEIYHAPSNVPFHRLPPAYLTTLRGVPLPIDLQRQVPGRSHLVNREDLLPTVSVDEEGENVVIDDIEFCTARIPPGYCFPAPTPSSAQPIPGKQYLWQSFWLDGIHCLIEPLSMDELRHNLSEHARRYRDEVDLFVPKCSTRATFEQQAERCRNADPTRSPPNRDPTNLETLDEIDDQEDNDDGNASDDSEWSENMDVDIGWWHRRRRRRRPRRNTAADSHSSNEPEPDTVDPLLVNARARHLRSPHRVRSGQRRRSMRRRNLIRHRLIMDRRRSDLRIERERRRSSYRRTLRSRTRQSGVLHTTLPAPPAEESAVSCLTTDLLPVTESTAQQLVSEEDLISARRERLKRRLLRTVDYIVSTGNPVPITTCPPGGYEGPDCEGQTFPTHMDQAASLWSGPHFDWLSTCTPIPTPYIPQVGDELVYIRRGHEQYLQSAWKHGVIPQSDDRGAADLSRDSDITSVPWSTWPELPPYLYGTVQNIAYHIIRVRADTPIRGIPSGQNEPSKRRTKHVRPSSKRSETSHVDDDPAQDTFVRLVSLRLSVNENQTFPFLTPNCDVDFEGHREITVTYHDVDGVLDFLVLRHIFDGAIHRTWNLGDPFICPVGTVWWLGAVVTSPSSTSQLVEPIPSCSTAIPTPPTLMHFDPWLCITVRWSTSDSANIASNSATSLEHLSPWDLHPWNPQDLSEEAQISETLDRGLHLRPERLRQLYGSDSIHFDDCFGTRIPYLIQCIEKIMQLPISQHFNQPVDLAAYPDYLFVNPYPMDLSLIRARLSSGFYRQVASMRADMDQLLENTIRYNEPDSSIVQDARLIHGVCCQCLSEEVVDIEQQYHQLLQESESTRQRENRTHSLSASEQEPQSSGTPSDSVHVLRKRPSRQSSHRQHVSSHNEPCSKCVFLPETWATECLTQIKRLLSHRQSVFFRQPIDTDMYPDYLSIVQEPMDLSTVMHRLQASLNGVHAQRGSRSLRSRRFYLCPHDCLNDLRLIVHNSTLYNEDPDTTVFEDTLWLREWIDTVFEPQCDQLNRTEPSTSRTKPSAPPNVRIRIRQSKLACRKLALRYKRKRFRSQRMPLRSKPSPDSRLSGVSDSCPFQRTSSGRIVRPPPRDINIISSLSDHDLSGSDTEFDGTVSTEPGAFLPESSLRRSKRRRRSSSTTDHRS